MRIRNSKCIDGNQSCKGNIQISYMICVKIDLKLSIFFIILIGNEFSTVKTVLNRLNILTLNPTNNFFHLLFNVIIF